MRKVEDISCLLNKYDELAYPVVYYQGNLVALSVDAKETPHIFGGPFPENCLGLGSQESHRLVLTLDVSCLSIKLPEKAKPERLPLVFDFDLFGLATDYAVEGDILNFDHKDCYLNKISSDGGPELPFDNYPAKFRRRSLGESVKFRTDFDAFQSKFTSQGLDNEQDLYILVPPYKGFRCSMWGKDGDQEGLLCVFAINTKSWLVEATNQST